MFPRRNQPLWYLDFKGATSLARLGFLEAVARALLSAVVPLAALEALDDKATVSWVYTLGAAMALAVTLNTAVAERFVLRRWVTTAGLLALIGSSVVFAYADGVVFAVGIALLAAAASIFSVTLSLYIMESVDTSDLRRSESRRLVYAGAAWLLGPAGGAFLADRLDSRLPFLVSALVAAAALGYFWALRLGSNPVLVAPTAPPPNPLVAVPRFFRQRPLRIAYCITLVRAMFWVAIFVYGSIYVVEAGLPTWASGVFLSLVATLLFAAPLIVDVAERFGTRRTIQSAFWALTAAMLVLAVLREPTPAGLIAWAVGAFAGSTLDVLGNLPFMRVVDPSDRVEMTAVFSTWRDTSALAAPLLAAVVLSVAPFWAFYCVLAVLAAATGWYARLLSDDL